MCLCQVYVPEQRFVLPEVQEFRDFNFLLAKVQLEAGETTFFRAVNPRVSRHGTFAFTPLYHRWNTCKTLLPWDLSYRLSQANETQRSRLRSRGDVKYRQNSLPLPVSRNLKALPGKGQNHF